jgi:hypothetical protein
MCILGAPQHVARLAGLLQLSLAAALHAPAPGHARETATFDFGWRFRLGLHGTPAAGGPPEPQSSGPGPEPKEAAAGYDDSAWARVHLPHDGLVAQGASNVSCPTGCSGRSFIPRHVMWYRKSFALPTHWRDGASTETQQQSEQDVWVEFDGVFHATIVYLNGAIVARNAEGYLGFRVPLDNATGTLRGAAAGKPNVLAVFVDPDGGAGFSPIKRSGWWYEGGGIYRHARVVRVATLRVAQDGLVARSEIQFADFEATAAAATATAAESASLVATATIENAGTAAAAAGATVVFMLVERGSGEVVGKATSAVLGLIPAGGSADATASISVSSPKLWNARTPQLYTVMAELSADNGGPAIDAVNVTHGFRTLVFSGADDKHSCELNGDAFKWRGFCDHDNFAVTGMAVPDRIKLFRAQMSRAIGGNSRRTSHNPPDPVMLSIYDALGTVVMDETRQFNAENSSVAALAALVRRDRNHPCVAMWSFCNEAACEQKGPEATNPQLGAPMMRAAAKSIDPTRPVAANTPGWHGNYPPWIPTDILTENIDIQGFSHTSSDGACVAFHAMPQYSTKPIFGSECCSCNTMRDEDVGCESSNGQTMCVQKSFSADCSQAQTEVYDNPSFVVGTMVSADSFLIIRAVPVLHGIAARLRFIVDC